MFLQYILLLFIVLATNYWTRSLEAGSSVGAQAVPLVEVLMVACNVRLSRQEQAVVRVLLVALPHFLA